MKRYLVIVFGLIFLAIGGFMFYKNISLTKNCTIETEATVVDMKEEFSSDSDTLSYMYYPIIKYKANDETIKVTMSSGSSTPKYNINEKVTILYNPNKIKEFIVKEDKSLNIFSIVFMALGIIITGFGIKNIIKNEN